MERRLQYSMSMKKTVSFILSMSMLVTGAVSVYAEVDRQNNTVSIDDVDVTATLDSEENNASYEEYPEQKIEESTS